MKNGDRIIATWDVLLVRCKLLMLACVAYEQYWAIYVVFAAVMNYAVGSFDSMLVTSSLMQSTAGTIYFHATSF